LEEGGAKIRGEGERSVKRKKRRKEEEGVGYKVGR